MSDTENITVTAKPVSTEQYLRTCSLIVGNAAGEGIDLSTLRTVFNVRAASVSTPRQLNARIYNVSKATAALIEKEYVTVSLSAGYHGKNGLLFNGSIQQKRYGRENPTDTFLDIFASDGYEVVASGFISQTLAAGWTYLDVYNEIIKAGAANGLKASNVLPPAFPKGARPLTLFGPIRTVLERLSKNLGLKWQIDQGVLTFVPPSVADQQLAVPPASMVSAYSTSYATVLSPSTGLIGIPVQTLDGIEATCLINSHVKPGAFVKIDKSLITAGQHDLSVGAVNAFPSITTDGIYRVMWTEHEGDTRGNPWYTHLVAEAADPNAATTIQQGAIEKAGFNGGL